MRLPPPLALPPRWQHDLLKQGVALPPGPTAQHGESTTGHATQIPALFHSRCARGSSHSPAARADTLPRAQSSVSAASTFMLCTRHVRAKDDDRHLLFASPPALQEAGPKVMLRLPERGAVPLRFPPLIAPTSGAA